MASGDIKPVYAVNQVVTISAASLVSDTNLLAGQESNAIDNTTNLYDDYEIDGDVPTGSNPTTAKEIRVYVVGMRGDATWPDVFDGSDSNETVTTSGIRDSICKLAAVMVTDATTNRVYPFGPVSVKSLFGGYLPAKFIVFIVHNTGVALKSSGIVVNARGIYYNVAP